MNDYWDYDAPVSKFEEIIGAILFYALPIGLAILSELHK